MTPKLLPLGSLTVGDAGQKVICTTDKSILRQYKHAGTTVCRENLDPAIVNYLYNSLFIPLARSRLEAIDGLYLYINSDNPELLRPAPNQTKRLDVLGVDAATNCLKFTNIFPEPAARPLIEDFKKLIESAGEIFPKDSELKFGIWTLTKAHDFNLHTDMQITLGKTYGPHGTEFGKHGAFQPHPDIDHDFIWNNTSEMWQLMPGDTAIFDAQLPHRGGTTTPAGQPRFWGGVFGPEP